MQLRKEAQRLERKYTALLTTDTIGGGGSSSGGSAEELGGFEATEAVTEETGAQLLKDIRSSDSYVAAEPITNQNPDCALKGLVLDSVAFTPPTPPVQR